MQNFDYGKDSTVKRIFGEYSSLKDIRLKYREGSTSSDDNRCTGENRLLYCRLDSTLWKSDKDVRYHHPGKGCAV